MRSQRSLQHLLAALCMLAPVAFAQTTLPATAPTAVQEPAKPRTGEAHGRTEITWAANQLQIHADGERLNDLLRETGAKAGIDVRGTAPDEPIFGTYGPGTVDEVLSDLLSGMAVNVLVVDHPGTQRTELVLTSRVGGATGPAALTAARPAPPAYVAPSAPSQQPPQSLNSRMNDVAPEPGTAAAPDAAAPAPAASSDGQPQSPNGVKTPQEIFEQLQRLRRGQTNPQ